MGVITWLMTQPHYNFSAHRCYSWATCIDLLRETRPEGTSAGCDCRRGDGGRKRRRKGRALLTSVSSFREQIGGAIKRDTGDSFFGAND